MKRGLLDQRWKLFATTHHRWINVSSVISTLPWYRKNGAAFERYMPIDVFKVNWSNPTYVYYSDRHRYQALNQIGNNAAEITTESKLFLTKLFDRIFYDQYRYLSADIREAIATELLMLADSSNYRQYRSKWSITSHGLA